MYNFIFYVLYQANIKDGRLIARINGAMIVFLAMLIHLLFFSVVLKRIFTEQFEESGIKDWFNEHKPIYGLILILLTFFVYQYYNYNRIDNIVNKYSGKIKER